MKIINIKKLPKKVKIEILNQLGYESDGKYVLKDGERVKDKYTGDPIKLDDMFIYPGSTIIISNNPLSIASFFEEHGDVL